MQDIVDSVKRVTDIMGEISIATREQSSGIEQVNQAIGMMDQVVQQNAALVEESASAAASLEEQASGLSQVVSIFKLDTAHTPVVPVVPAAPVRKAVAAARPAGKPVPKPAAAKLARATPADEAWEEF